MCCEQFGDGHTLVTLHGYKGLFAINRTTDKVCHSSHPFRRQSDSLSPRESNLRLSIGE